MAPAAPFLPGIQTTICGRARAKTAARAAAATDSFHRASLCALARIFRAWIPDALLSPAVSGAHSRRRVFSFPVMFWAFLSQTLSPNTPCRAALDKVIAWCALKDRTLPSTNTAAYCTARLALPLGKLHAVNGSVADTMEQRVPADGLWHGRRVVGVDGTGLSMPDTPANQKKYPQPSGQKKGCGFPVVKIVAFFSIASGALLAWTEGTWRQHDSLLWRVLWRILLPGDVALGDRAFCSFASIAFLRAIKVDSVFRLHQGRSLPTFKRGSRECLVTWHKPARPKSWKATLWKTLPDTIVLRILKVSLSIPGFRTQHVLLATSLLDTKEYPAQDIADLYRRRWAVELFFRDIKTSMRMDVLAGLTPAMIQRETAMFAIAYNLLRALMQDAANAYHADLSRISFKGTADRLREWCASCAQDLLRPSRFPKLYADLIFLIAKDLVPLRPGRSEPRALKRRPKPYSFLTKPRHKMRVPPHRGRPNRQKPRSPLAA